MVRPLRQAGYQCEVVPPSKIPRKPGELVKTDRAQRTDPGDWRALGQLSFVTVLGERDEAMRDLSRARTDAVRADHIFTPAQQVEFVSHVVTLLPGDVISTGAPPNVRPIRHRRDRGYRGVAQPRAKSRRCSARSRRLTIDLRASRASNAHLSCCSRRR
jgi:hypothetical protein